MIVVNKKELDSIIKEEKALYLSNIESRAKQMKKSNHKRYLIFKYLYYFRHCQYYRNLRSDKNCTGLKKTEAKYRYRYYDRKRNIYSYKAGVEIGLDSDIGKCCDIWHSGVVINGTVGENCVFHGNNTIGNKGIAKDNLRPVIGNNVDIGAGAVIIGNNYIADNCVIGAGAVVTKSFEKIGSVIAGVPAKTIN